ncbi:MAG TPA: hypothetical protein VGL80_18840 [Pseudonocardiaceae bacterium]
MTSNNTESTTKPPGPVLISFWILIASAALRAVIAVITLADWQGFVNAQLRNPLPANTTVVQAREAIHTFLTVNVTLDLLFAVLYVFCAYKIKVGRNWARIALTVVVVLFALFNILGGTDIVTVISILVELVAVALLYTPTAKPFFAKPEPA